MNATNTNSNSTVSIEDRFRAQLMPYLYPQNPSNEKQVPVSGDEAHISVDPAQEPSAPAGIDPLDEPQVLNTQGDLDHDKWVLDTFGGADYIDFFGTQPEQEIRAAEGVGETTGHNNITNQPRVESSSQDVESPQAQGTSTQALFQRDFDNGNRFNALVSPEGFPQLNKRTPSNSSLFRYPDNTTAEPPPRGPSSDLDDFIASVDPEEFQHAIESILRGDTTGTHTTPKVRGNYDNDSQSPAPPGPNPPTLEPQVNHSDDVFAPLRTGTIPTEQAPPPTGAGHQVHAPKTSILKGLAKQLAMKKVKGMYNIVSPSATPAPATPSSRSKSGPKLRKRGDLPSNIDNPLSAPSTSNFPRAGQMASWSPQQDIVSLTGSTSPLRTQQPTSRLRGGFGAPATPPSLSSGARDVDEESSFNSSNASRSPAEGRKRKAHTEPKGGMSKRTKMITDRVTSAQQTVQAQLESFKRNLDSPMDAAFAVTAAAAIQQISTLEAAEDFVTQRSPLVKFYKLRVTPEDDNVDQVEGEVLEHVRSTILACLQHPPMAAPFTYDFREAYNHDHNNRYKDLMKRLANKQNHLEAASKVLILIETVKRVHTKGIAMADLNDSDFKTQDDYESELLPEVATTRSCKKVIDQDTTCISQLFKIAEVIKTNKWMAADVMNSSSAAEYMFLICNPELYLKLKTDNWDTNHRRKLEKAARRADREAADAADGSDD